MKHYTILLFLMFGYVLGYAQDVSFNESWEELLDETKALYTNAYPGEPLHAGCVSYHLRRGKHDLNLQDWTWYMNFADKNGFKEYER